MGLTWGIPCLHCPPATQCFYIQRQREAVMEALSLSACLGEEKAWGFSVGIR